jgi:hypothetical protein
VLGVEYRLMDVKESGIRVVEKGKSISYFNTIKITVDLINKKL